MMSEVTPATDHYKRTLLIANLRSGGPIMLRAWGTSMLPVIWPGDVLTIENSSGQLNLGDIVLAERGGRFFVHRLVGRASENWMLLRGDALGQPDPAVTRSQVLGRVTAICGRQGTAVRSPRLTVLKRLAGLLLGEFHRVRNLVLCLYSRKQAAGTGAGWSAGDLPV